MSIIGINKKNEMRDEKIEINTITKISATNDIEDVQEPLETLMHYDLTFKVIVLGNSGVGKSSLLLKGIKNEIYELINPTIGFEYFTFATKISNQIVKLNIWDTCGQEIYKSLVKNFYRNSSLAIVVYAINDKLSFENLEHLIKELKSNTNPHIKLILIGNKIDLEDRQVSYEEALNFKLVNKLDLFFETSALKNENVKQIFTEAANLLFSDYTKFCDEKLEGPNNIDWKQLKKSEISKNVHPYDNNIRLPSKRSLIKQQQRDKDRYKCKSCSC